MPLENYIWYEKYRPKTLDQMVLQPEYHKAFQQYIADGDIPHLLFVGPPGSGKTTLALVLIEAIPCFKLILNASSKDRGIETIRGPVREFASSMPLKGKIKIIFMDEFDQCSVDSMKALRNTMETYSNTCKFILTGNYQERIIPEIHSRCIKYEFNSFPRNELTLLIRRILSAENCRAKDKDLNILIDRFYPDMRSIINTLQQGCKDKFFNLASTNLSSYDSKTIFDLLAEGELRKIREKWAGTMDFLWLYKTLFDEFIQQVEEESRPEIALIIADYLYKDGLVADHEINASACLVQLMNSLGIKAKL